MTDDTEGPAGPRVTRRGALAVGGAALLAGCGVPKFLGSGPVEVDGGEVAEIASRDYPQIAEPLPVDVKQAHVATSRERAYSLLAAAPLPLTADELPNGAMREDVHDHAEHARTHLAEAVEVAGTRERLELLAHARGPARTVAATWAYTRDELTAADVREAWESHVADVETFREQREFVGVDPVRAVIVHDVVDRWLADAADDGVLRSAGEELDTALVVGEHAGAVEEGEAALADARHVYEQFVDSLSDPTSIRERVLAAHDSLDETIDSRLADLPGEDADVLAEFEGDLERTVVGEALRSLHSDLPYEVRVPDDPGAATTLLGRVDGLAEIGAFETVRDRVEAGDYRTVEDVEDVLEIRRAAVTAMEDAPGACADERLGRTVLADLTGWFDYVERDLSRYDDPVEVADVADELAVYVGIEAIASATPAAVDEGLAALDVA
ncbi:hypothetical protein [Halosimplex amylolyticum]|uniref:hypothetical protein n=1 Tax=Halosimplex amylolyticum TaxID=3396616 RepID=UPI003F562127